MIHMSITPMSCRFFWNPTRILIKQVLNCQTCSILSRVRRMPKPFVGHGTQRIWRSPKRTPINWWWLGDGAKGRWIPESCKSTILTIYLSNLSIFLSFFLSFLPSFIHSFIDLSIYIHLSISRLGKIRGSRFRISVRSQPPSKQPASLRSSTDARRPSQSRVLKFFSVEWGKR